MFCSLTIGFSYQFEFIQVYFPIIKMLYSKIKLKQRIGKGYGLRTCEGANEFVSMNRGLIAVILYY